MEEASTSISNAGKPPPPKRRKIRRGTQSCWECKRRKTRCTFASPNEPTCDGCRSRKLKCVSQQFEYGLGTAERGGQTGDRSRTETAFGRLSALNQGDPRNSDFHVGEEAEGKTASSSSAEAGPATPRVNTRHDGLCRALLEEWPRQEDLDMILGAPVSTSILFHGTVCVPYSSLLSQAMPSPREMLQPPSPRSHPVLIARKLLLLATFMQGIPEDAMKDLGILGGSHKPTMSRLAEVSSRTVTSDDELVSSLEGIECIMIEAMYHNNAGNIRRAWVTHRRAMAIAQMLGLHRGVAPAVMLLDVRDRGRIDPEHMWYRLIISDRYLSLILGLPQGSLENPFGSPQALETCMPLERMERMESIAGGLILQRNEADLHDLVKTQEIDRLLREAAALMPPQWWLAPCTAALVGNDSEALHQTIRLMNQFTHYHLLVQLHLPCLLRTSDEQKHEYSKATAVMASREILTRFVSFRGSAWVAAYCKGIDLLAFVASTVLSLAHISARRPQHVSASDCGTTLHMVAHQRLSDRALLEHTLECISKMAESGEDATACKISNILKRLLAIEDDATKDEPYKTTISSEPGDLEPESRHGNDVFGAGHSLRIHIPYFGTIKIEHSTCSLSRSTGVEQASLDRTPRASSSLDSLGHDREGYPETALLVPGLTADLDDWALQGVDMALFGNLIRGAAEPSADPSTD
ncbi:hypothetical protein F5883DRAFT_413641 [Diaporthe sp. PMI_573]|nr:hypothetical protein F5883DRAFT_413641 [Diaporthaceae sp. PMI_573]